MYVWPPDAVQVMSSGSGQAGLRVVSHTGQGSGSPPASSGLGVLAGLQPWPGRSSGTSRELVWWWHDMPGRGSPEPILGSGAAAEQEVTRRVSPGLELGAVRDHRYLPPYCPLQNVVYHTFFVIHIFKNTIK